MAQDLFAPSFPGYYLIVGIDAPSDLIEQVTRFKEVALPQPFVFTPYNFAHDSMYAVENPVKRVEMLLQVRAFLLRLYGRPIPGGSNRSLFPLNAKEAHSLTAAQ